MAGAAWAVAAATIAALIAFGLYWLKQKTDQGTGATLQAGRDAQAALVKETAIATAEAQAPTDLQGVAAAAKAGDF